jgi:outer membrane protein OmpA-like peptidoglycan-associated protein/uncharacterized protein YidB (DUF937 family)
MSTFDNVIQEIDKRYCLGPKAGPLIQETVRLVSKQPGGLRGFIRKFGAAGFPVEVASWLDGSEPVPLSGQEVEHTLGSDAVSKIAAKIDVSQPFARTILGYAIPNVVVPLAQGGAIPAAFRALASRFFASVGGRSPFSLERKTQGGAEQIRSNAAQDGRAAPFVGGLIIPYTTALIVLGSVLGYFIGAGNRGLPQSSPIMAQNEPEVPVLAPSMPTPVPFRIGNHEFPPATVSGANEVGMVTPALSRTGGNSQAGTAKLPVPKFPAIYFATNRAKPLPASSPVAPKAAQLIKQLPVGTLVEIEGYTDNVGSPAANMRLSQRRANAVRQALVRAGVDANMLVAKGYGSSRPLTLAGQEATIEGRSNALAGDRLRTARRVEFSVRQY